MKEIKSDPTSKNFRVLVIPGYGIARKRIEEKETGIDKDVCTKFVAILNSKCLFQPTQKKIIKVNRFTQMEDCVTIVLRALKLHGNLIDVQISVVKFLAALSAVKSVRQKVSQEGSDI